MIYLSQLLYKTVYYENRPFGKLLDMAILENRPVPPISKLMIKKNEKKLTIPPTAISIENNRLVLKTQNIPLLPYDENDFYLNEDLLDKQVIDIDGKRLVRVNDVLLENNGELKVMGIDIGLSGILRRLGLGTLVPIKTKTLPWTIIEAFDYQTGAIRIKLTQNRLNKFHPAEIAEILEQAGTKERLGIVEVLDAKKAARTIEELDNQTQLSVLEQLSPNTLKDVVNKMLVSEIADVFYKLNPLRIKEIMKFLGHEKAQRVERLSRFSDDVAGGLMDPSSYYQISGEKTVKELLNDLSQQQIKPEAIVATNGNNRILGIIYTKNLINIDPLALLEDIITQRKFVYPETNFLEILRLFSQYNLRILPVVNKEKQIVGVIKVDKILEKIENQEERNDVL